MAILQQFQVVLIILVYFTIYRFSLGGMGPYKL